MTREQKINLIELIQEYFRDACEENVEQYGYTIPNYELLDMFSLAIFKKGSTKSIGFDRTVHKHIYKSDLTLEEKQTINNEYKELLSKGVLMKTKSGKATRVSDKILWYNNILY